VPKPVFADPHERYMAGVQGLRIFLGSLAMLFAASIVGFVVIRVRSEHWSSLDLPPLPRRLWASTAILLASSVTMQAALAALARRRHGAAAALVWSTLTLGAMFLLVQAQAWLEWGPPAAERLRGTGEAPALAVAGFFVLTGVHAAHVIGGLLPLAVSAIGLLARCIGPDRPGLLPFVARYWHFLDAVWIVLFLTLHLAI
jgi:cytochrome c oxidase subunit 3